MLTAAQVAGLADELAEAMESRGYRGGEGRTRLKVLRFTKADLGGALACLCVIALFAALRLLLPAV